MLTSLQKLIKYVPDPETELPLLSGRLRCTKTVGSAVGKLRKRRRRRQRSAFSLLTEGRRRSGTWIACRSRSGTVFRESGGQRWSLCLLRKRAAPRLLSLTEHVLFCQSNGLVITDIFTKEAQINPPQVILYENFQTP